MHGKGQTKADRDTSGRRKKDSTIQNISPQFFIEAPQLQNGVKFTKTAERYSFTIASVQRKGDDARKSGS